MDNKELQIPEGVENPSIPRFQLLNNGENVEVVSHVDGSHYIRVFFEDDTLEVRMEFPARGFSNPRVLPRYGSARQGYIYIPVPENPQNPIQTIEVNGVQVKRGIDGFRINTGTEDHLMTMGIASPTGPNRLNPVVNVQASVPDKAKEILEK